MPEMITCAECGAVSKTLKGWKGHMARAHGGWNDDDLRRVLGGDTEGDYKKRMEQFAVGGETQTETPQGEGGAESPSGAPPPKITPLEPTVRRVRATPKKLKKIISALPRKMLEEQGITLDEEDNEAIEECSEFLTELFGFDFEIDQKKVTLHSRVWALVWVVGVMFMVYAKHKFSNVFAKIVQATKTAEQEQTAQADD